MLPKNLKKYFWDVDFKKLDFKMNPEFIIARILEYGDIAAAKWLFKNFTAEEIKKNIRKSREVSLKSANFWKLFFNLKNSEIACLNKHYQETQKTHWLY